MSCPPPEFLVAMPKSPHGAAPPTMAPAQKIIMIKAVSFVWSCDGYAIMCDQNGAEMWRKTLKLEHEKHFDARQVTVLLKLFTSGPRKGEGYVFAGFNRFAIAMDATTGDTVWIHTFDESFARGPVTFAVFPKTPVIYVASKGKIKGIFADDGTKKWSRNLPGTGYDVVNMAIGKSKDQLFAGTRGNVFLLNGDNGEIVWNKQIKGNRFGQSTSACHTCVCLCDNGHQIMYGMHGRLGGLAAVSGDQVWERKIKKLECTDSLVPLLAVTLRNQQEEELGALASPTMKSKQFVFAASAGVVYCCDPQQCVLLLGCTHLGADPVEKPSCGSGTCLQASNLQLNSPLWPMRTARSSSPWPHTASRWILTQGKSFGPLTLPTSMLL